MQRGKARWRSHVPQEMVCWLEKRGRFNLILSVYWTKMSHLMQCYIDVKRSIQEISTMVVHHGCSWCSSPPLPSSTCGPWNKVRILVSWICFQAISDRNQQVIFNTEPIWLLVRCMECSKVDYRRDKCRSSISRRWFLSVSRTISPCSTIHHQ